MIETGRREITNIATRRRIARHLGVPTHVIGVTDPDDIDFTAMLQFGESTIRLAVLARQAGRGTEAVNELWPLVARLEARVADCHIERHVLLLLARASAELGVSLGYVLPEERLTSAARWTGRALWLAERLGDRDLFAFALRVHGNELRKVGRLTAALARLRSAATLAPDGDQGAVLVQFARAVGDSGDPGFFDRVIVDARRQLDARPAAPLLSWYVLREVHLRGLLRTGRIDTVANLLGQPAPSADVPPQWRAICQITVGEALLAHSDRAGAEAELIAAIETAERHRLPHQIQRAARTAGHRLPSVADLGKAAFGRLVRPLLANQDGCGDLR